MLVDAYSFIHPLFGNPLPWANSLPDVYAEVRIGIPSGLLHTCQQVKSWQRLWAAHTFTWVLLLVTSFLHLVLLSHGIYGPPCHPILMPFDILFTDTQNSSPTFSSLEHSKSVE